MSVAEAERFATDLASNSQLRDAVKAGAGGLSSVVGIANKSGYSFTIDEAKQYMQSQSAHQLNDAQLDAVAGGKSTTATTTTTTTSSNSAAQVVVTGPTTMAPVTEVIAVATMSAATVN